ncbi:MAG: sugar ABC transporter permease [Pseudomonadota bacterium]
MSEGDRLHTVTRDDISPQRIRLGRAMVWGAAGLLALAFAVQGLFEAGVTAGGFETWRPVLYAYLIFSVCLCWSTVLIRGERGKRALFVMPAALFVVSIVIFPLIFAIGIALTDWNLASIDGPEFNGTANFAQMWQDAFYWNALTNMVWYVLAISVEYVIAFGLALLLNAQIRARKFFRVAFLLPLMLSPVAVSWMIGKSMLEVRFGPISRLAKWLGWDSPTFFSDPAIAKATIMIMDAWTWIPLMMVILLAGLQTLDREVIEASKVDGATPWQRFREVIFPLMIPVSITALLIRIIFKLKLADIIINVTSGGPGGATDSVTSFVFREYRDRSNVGYGTLLAVVYLLLIIIVMASFIGLTRRWMRTEKD